MKTANEWYRKINSYSNPSRMNDVEREWIEKMINEARKEAIEECAKRVTLCGKLYCDEDDFSDVEVVNMTNKRGYVDTIIKPDKQSILSLINELQ